jgi:glycosyltransferase involved in cell wall biosynthesis
MAEQTITARHTESSGNGHNSPISIGMPVYNGANTLRQALDSLLTQSFSDFLLLISDNASTDDTGEICKQYSDSDPRVHYFRQSENIGADKNFRYVFDNTKSEYFMWAAADDIRSPDFLELNLKFLQQNPDYLGSTSPVRFKGRPFDQIAMGDASLNDNDRYQRLLKFFRGWHANGRFYSLFRRSDVAEWVYRHDLILGADWTLIIRLAAKGKLNRLDKGWVELGMGGVSNTTDILSPYRHGILDWLFPFRHLAKEVWKLMGGASPIQRALMIVRIVYLNVLAFSIQLPLMARKTRN